MLKSWPLFFVAMLSACGRINDLPSSPAQWLARGATTSSPISHVVIVVQENRSFDNFFNCFKGTECKKWGKEEVRKGTQYVERPVKLTEQHLVPPHDHTDIGHCYFAFITAYHDGKMDGFDLEPKNNCPRQWGGDYKASGTFPYQFINPVDIAPYWSMASQYGLADRMFQTQGSGSFTAHQDLIRGDTVVDSARDSMVDTPDGEPWGCDSANPAARTNLLTPTLEWELDQGPFPCSNKFFGSASSDYQTLGDLLDAKGIQWRYYSPCYSGSPGSGCNDDCNTCIGALLNAFDVIYHVRYGPEWGTNVSMPQTNILSDIQNNQLQPVSWVIPSQTDSDHPGDSVDNGPSWVASIVNAIGQSPYWSDSAVIVLWDDWGGMYDHVAPPKKRDSQGGPGFRVPMIVISPYVPQGEVVHTRYGFGSILRYVEDNWALGSLGTTDATSNSIIDMFDYSQAPRQFVQIPAPLGIDHFKHEPPSAAPADTE